MLHLGFDHVRKAPLKIVKKGAPAATRFDADANTNKQPLGLFS